MVVAGLAACGQPPGAAPRAPATHAARPDAAPAPGPVPLDPPRRLLAIDWRHRIVTTDAEALALWRDIAPTGADWAARLDEVPVEYDRTLAIALLRAGNFACAPPPATGDCAPRVFEVPDPADTAGLDDPCLRRQLALWSLQQLEDEDIPSVMDALRTFAAMPPPEAALPAAALAAVATDDPARRLELIGLAARAGQHEIAGAGTGGLDEPELIAAVIRYHVGGALEVLDAEAHRAAFVAAVTDDAIPAPARAQAITELAAVAGPLAPEVRAALVRATAAADCTVAAAAASALARHGDRRYLPRPGRTGPAMMRALCVLASYEDDRGPDEPALLPGFVPARGLEQIEVAYDALSDTDDDGDGDPHTTHTRALVPRDGLVLPEGEDLVRAMRRCTGTTCTSRDHEFRFGLRPARGARELYRIEVVERPPCPSR